MKLQIFTDGSYSSSRNQGGVGLLILKNFEIVKEYYNGYSNVTNNQMEIWAIILALKCIKNSYESIIIYTDSKYCIGCGIKGWERKKNKKLWKEFDKQLDKVKELCSNIKFIHVKGHQDDNSLLTKYNNHVDKLAQKGSKLVL